jgi:predicted transcriptional regulator
MDRSSAHLIASILQRCSQSADGYPFKCKSDLLQDLADNGLVLISDNGWVVTTEKGKLALCSLAAAVDQIPQIAVH